MAGRSRRSAAAEVVEEEEDQEEVKQLRFKQSLVGRLGKPIGVGELQSRLKTLCEELRTLEQEEADRESLEPVAKELAHTSLIHHKDAGVRAWAACCVVDMFRLCAPDAPYTASQLKDIFTLIVNKIFPQLADPSNPYNAQHLYVLKCLAEVKSIVLLTDIPSSTQLTTALFKTCFDVLSGPSKASNGEELSKNVEHHMTSVLSILIDEAPTLSSEVVDIIVAQFLLADPLSLGATKGKKNAPVDAKQLTLLRREAPPAYTMAKNLCNACPDKMARYVGTYFSSVIVDFTSLGPSKHRRHRAGSEGEASDDEATKGPSEEEINDAQKAHRLLRELWRCAPTVLQDIIPHLQEELGTDNVQLRQLATETFGDMIAGIGAAGPPPKPELNPSAYPSQSLSPPEPRPYNFLTTPKSPNSFPNHYPGAYQSFFQRKHDKSPIIRAAWTTGVGHILMTSAGGVGLDSEQEQKLLEGFAQALVDSDERVRLAAIRAIGYFEFSDLIEKLGRNGSMLHPNTILANLADRVKDKKSSIQSESMQLLAKIWGVASGAIAEGHETVVALLGPIPSKILEACYVNDVDINLQVDLALFESLLPLGYPPMKPKAASNGASQASQVVRDSQATSDQGYTEADLDKIRVQRQLVLVNGLEERAKKVFFARQANQARGALYMESFLKLCEEYNGGVNDKSTEKEVKSKLDGLINFYGRTLPEPARVVADLWKFAEAHDRRSYQLIRFCMATESEYRKVFRSIKELRKRIEDGPVSSTLMETLTPLLYRVSLLCYNKSHVPAIIEFSRTNDGGLAVTAHDVLKEISANHPKVFSTHVKDLCKALESEAPTATTPNPPGAVEDLKACSAFAKKFPKEVPLNTKDGQKLAQSFVNFALYGTPPKAAKHAVTIIVNSDKKKEMRVKEILTKSMKDFEYGCDNFLTRLAAISQLVLLAPQECEDDIDEIIDIAVNRVLLKAHAASPEADQDWMETPDDDMAARTWALKVLVNRLRSFPAESNINDTATPIFAMLNRLVRESGEASKKKNTPPAHKSLQRLLASKSLLKLSCLRRLDALLSPADFNELAFVTHDPTDPVRKGFAAKLMKYLGQNRLPNRFYSMLFLFAYDPDHRFLESLTTWVRSRRNVFASRKEIVLETTFARLLSLLAHHPDYAPENDALKLLAKFILFYLRGVATQDNLSLIYHVAQRVKGVAEGITPGLEADERLYVLSDLAQALIRLWEEQNGWSMQAWPGKLKLPAGIFKPLASHEQAQEIAEKVWIDEDLSEELEGLVRQAIRGKKRKAVDGEPKARKKTKSEKSVREKKESVREKKEKAAKTPKPKRRRKTNSDEESGGEDEEADVGMRKKAKDVLSSEPRRKSGRKSGAGRSYIEVDSDEDEHVAAAGVEEEEDEEVEEQAANEAEEQSSSELSELNEDVEMAEPDAGTTIEESLQDEQEEEAEAEAGEQVEEQPEQEVSPEPEPEPEPKPKPKLAKKTTKQQTQTALPSQGRGRPKRAAQAAPATSSPAKSKSIEKAKAASKTATPAKSKNSEKPKAPSKTATPASAAKAKGKGKAKAKANGSANGNGVMSSSPAAASTPAVSSSVRRSTRARG